MCQRIEEEGWSLVAAAEAAGISEPRARAWLRRWRAGDRELADRKSGPAGRHPRRTDPEREAVIAELRSELWMDAVAIADPCSRLQLPDSGGVSGFVQDRALRLLDRLACENGSSREALTLALASSGEARAYEQRYGVNPRSTGGILEQGQRLLGLS